VVACWQKVAECPACSIPCRLTVRLGQGTVLLSRKACASPSSPSSAICSSSSLSSSSISSCNTCSKTMWGERSSKGERESTWCSGGTHCGRAQGSTQSCVQWFCPCCYSIWRHSQACTCSCRRCCCYWCCCGLAGRSGSRGQPTVAAAAAVAPLEQQQQQQPGPVNKGHKTGEKKGQQTVFFWQLTVWVHRGVFRCMMRVTEG